MMKRSRRHPLVVLLAAPLLSWLGPVHAQTLPMLVTLYDSADCTGEHIDIGDPTPELRTLGWDDRVRAFRIRYGAIQFVTGPDNNGARFPVNEDPHAWYTRADNMCVRLPDALAGHVLGIASFTPSKSQRACAQAAVQVFGVNFGAINDNIRACLGVTGDIVRSKQP